MSAALGAPRTTFSIPGSLRRQVELVHLSAVRQLRARYRGSAFGVLWSFLNPLMMTLLYTAIFGSAFAAYYGSRTVYVLSALVGVVIVTYFLQATADALPSVVGNGSLLNKIAIRAEIFPVASVAANTFQQCVTTFPLLVIIALVVTRDPLHAILVPFALAGFVALTLGFSLVLSASYVFFRDLPHLWGIIGFVLWLTSPVFYPGKLVPESVRPWLAVNPVGGSMNALRDLILTPGPVHWGALGQMIVTGGIALFIGIALFRATRNDFMDLL
jgi:ABC-type polysaccharide/polyol phosphate export permease